MKTIRTSPPRFYISPTREEMREIAEKVGLKKFFPDFVTDLTNLAAGGDLVPPSVYREKVFDKASKSLSKPDSNGKWQLRNGEWTKNRSQAIEDVASRAMSYHQSVQDFLRTVELDRVPGETPLEKAINLLSVLSKNKGGEGSGGEGDHLPIFQEENGEQVGREFNELIDTVDSLDDAERELLIEDEESNCKEDSNLQKRKILEDMDRDKEIWLKISRKLDKMTSMRVARSVKVMYSPEGQEVRNRPIRDLGEISRVTKPSWAIYQAQPNLFWLKAVTGSLPVRERVDREEKKQLLYMIIDCSGSMDNGARIAKAGGILFNRLKAVIIGEAEIYVRFFDSELHDEFHASTAKEAKELMTHFRGQNFSGNSTRIDACIRQVQKRIEEIFAQGKISRPELVVVTDGDDQVNITTNDVVGTKLHSFVVECSNQNLTNVSIRSGGVGVNCF